MVHQDVIAHNILVVQFDVISIIANIKSELLSHSHIAPVGARAKRAFNWALEVGHGGRPARHSREARRQLPAPTCSSSTSPSGAAPDEPN